MKLESELNPIDRELLAEATDGFMPESVFDFHAHVVDARFYDPDSVFPDLAGKTVDVAAYRDRIQMLLPGRRLEGAQLFPYTAVKTDREGVNCWMFSDLANGAAGFRGRGLAFVAPTDDPGRAEEWLQHPLCTGLKPYFLFADRPDVRQSGVEEYAPEWMWRLCDRHGAVLMLHLVRDAAVSDPGNREALLRLTEKYPRCRAVLAHVARSFNHRNARGLSALRGRPNVLVDISAITEPEGIKIALDVLGPGRVLYGSDYPECHLRGRCVTAGDSAQWIYADMLDNPRMTLVGIESLRSLRQACEQAGLGKAEVRRIFLGNALEIVGLGSGQP